MLTLEMPMLVVDPAEAAYRRLADRIARTRLPSGHCPTCGAWAQRRAAKTGRPVGVRVRAGEAGPAMRAPVKPHILQRSTWLCDAGEPWPCATRRASLLASYADNLDDLRRWMADCRDKFLADNPRVDPGEAEQRFRGWIPGDPS